MSRRRFYAPPEDISGATVNLSTEETHHLTHVLRLKPGDEVYVFDGLGREYRCTFASERDRKARLEIVCALTDVVESPLRLTLGQALAKGDKFDFIIQKATELGVASIAPLLTERTDVRLRDERADKRLERWRRISLEALKQSGRRKAVEIIAPLALEEFLDTFSLPTTVLVFSEKGGAAIQEALAELDEQTSVAALVGPEGGWSAMELELLDRRGCKAVSLGPRVLRTETAAVVAMALLQHVLGDLSRGRL